MFGSTQDISTALGTGVSVGLTILDINTTTSDVQTTTTDQSFTITKSTGSTEGMSSKFDTVNHDEDKFFLWTNPTINFSQPYANIPSLTLTLVPADPTKPDPTVTINVATVRGAEPDTYHIMDGWTNGDKKNLLAQDPFIASSTVNASTAYPNTATLNTVDPTAANPKRFSLLREIQTQGPDVTSSGIPNSGIPVTATTNQCNTTTQNDTTTVSVGGSYNFFGFGASAGASFSTSFSNSNQACNGTSQSGTVTLQSTTVGDDRPIAVYFDATYATFAFVDRTPSPLVTSITTRLGPNLTGRVTDSSGRPLTKQQINVTFSNGITRTLFSDSSGNYTVVSPPAGAITIRSGDLVQHASLAANKAAVIPLKVVNPKAALPLPTVPLRTTAPRLP